MEILKTIKMKNKKREEDQIALIIRRMKKRRKQILEEEEEKFFIEQMKKEQEEKDKDYKKALFLLLACILLNDKASLYICQYLSFSLDHPFKYLIVYITDKKIHSCENTTQLDRHYFKDITNNNKGRNLNDK